MIASAHHQQQRNVVGRIGGGDFKGRGIEEGIIPHTPFPSVRYVFCQRSASHLLPASMQSSNPTAAAQMARMTEATQAFASTTRTSVMNAADGTGLSSRYHRSRRVVSIPIQRTRAVGDPARSHKERLGNGGKVSSAEGSPLRSSATRTTGLPAVISKRVALQAHSRDSAMSTRRILLSSDTF